MSNDVVNKQPLIALEVSEWAQTRPALPVSFAYPLFPSSFSTQQPGAKFEHTQTFGLMNLIRDMREPVNDHSLLFTIADLIIFGPFPETIYPTIE